MSAPLLIDHRKGLALSVSGVILISPDALFIRLVEQAGPWETAALRSGFFALVMLALILVRDGRHAFQPLVKLGHVGAFAVLAFALTNLGFVGALTQTTAANALLIIATVPLWGALLGWFILRERVARRTMTAIVLAVTGTAIIVGGNLGSGQWLGDGIALGTALVLGLNLVFLRKAGGHLFPIMAAGSAVASVAAAVMVLLTGGFVAYGQDIVVTFVNGGLQLPLALGLYFAGTRYLPAAEVALLSLVEAVLGPMIVWLVLGEMPGDNTFIGGSLVILAIVGNAAFALGAGSAGRRAA